VRVIHERNCSVGRTVAILSDGWAFLVLRECYFAATRFETFQAALGIPRATLAQRLRDLTVGRLLRRVQYSQRPKRFEYRLTQMGIELYPVMLALLAFGDKWLRKPLNRRSISFTIFVAKYAGRWSPARIARKRSTTKP
jgi:DNA-binding HxlR family transcriptional regulator